MRSFYTLSHLYWGNPSAASPWQPALPRRSYGSFLSVTHSIADFPAFCVLLWLSKGGCLLKFADLTSYFAVGKIREEIFRLRFWKSWRSRRIRLLFEWPRTLWPKKRHFFGNGGEMKSCSRGQSFGVIRLLQSKRPVVLQVVVVAGFSCRYLHQLQNGNDQTDGDVE